MKSRTGGSVSSASLENESIFWVGTDENLEHHHKVFHAVYRRSSEFA
jgi:hypothetical protein